jgi:hypothetical protein
VCAENYILFQPTEELTREDQMCGVSKYGNWAIYRLKRGKQIERNEG